MLSRAGPDKRRRTRKKVSIMNPQLSVFPKTQDHGELMPPYWTEESDEGFSIGFDMIACKEDSIRFLVNKQQRHLSVIAKLEGAESDVEYLWTFALPLMADLDHARIESSEGVYSLKFPRLRAQDLIHHPS